MDQERKKKPGFRMVEVPEEEDVKIVDVKLTTIFLGIAGCMTVAGVAYTYYTFIRARAEKKRIDAVTASISTVAKEIAGIMKQPGIAQDIKSAEGKIATSIINGRSGRKKGAQA